jgi:glucose-1-phosphate thymidylyltransferase
LVSKVKSIGKPSEAVGILLAGGNGSRLAPLTHAVNKHLLPIFDKPMFFHPLSTLLLAQIRKIIMIVRPADLDLYKSFFHDGRSLGIEILYKVQDKPIGIPDAYSLTKSEIDQKNSMLVLGDNILLGQGMASQLSILSDFTGARIFGFPVNNPSEYGVIDFDFDSQTIRRIIEKPESFVSNLAIPGIYFMDSTVFDRVSCLTPSNRGELEMVDLLNLFLNDGGLQVEIFQRGIGWLDAGTVDSLFLASETIKVLQERQGLMFANPDEIAWRNGWIDDGQLMKNATRWGSTKYSEYLKGLLS